jgi:hypothetical protein
MNIENKKLELEKEQSRRRAGILELENKDLGIDIKFNPLIKLVVWYQNNGEKEFSKTLNEKEITLINEKFNKIANTIFTNDIINDTDYAHKLEMILRYDNDIRIKDSENLDRKTLFSKTTKTLIEKSIANNAKKIVNNANFEKKYEYLLHLYIRSELKNTEGWDQFRKIELKLIHDNPERQKNKNDKLVIEYEKQREKILQDLETEYFKNHRYNPANQNIQKQIEKIIEQLSNTLISIEVNDEMQHDYLLATYTAIKSVRGIFDKIKISDDLKEKINQTICNINQYKAITESNLEEYKKVDEISDCIAKILAALDISSKSKLCIKPNMDPFEYKLHTDQIAQCENIIIHEYCKLKKITNSLDQSSSIARLFEEIIDFFKELFNIPTVTFKLTASHQESQVPCSLETTKTEGKQQDYCAEIPT